MAQLTFNSAMRLLTLGKHQDVYNLAVSALQKNEKDPLAFFFLGIVAGDHGQHGKALEFHAKAAELAPLNVRYHAAHAKALMTLGYKTDAKLRADTAAKIGTQDAFVADMIGTVYSRAGHHDLAIPLFRKAVQLNPKWPIFQFNLGASAQFIGDLIAARSAYKKAVKLDPKFSRAWFSLVSLEKQTPENNHVETLKGLFARAGQDVEARSLLGHALAKTFEDLGKFPESLAWLGKAKHAHNTRTPYNETAMKNMFAAAKTGSKTASAKLPKTDDITPIFIVGMPRTGTTLVDRVLSSHPDVTSAGEIDLFTRIIEAKTQVSRDNPASFFKAAHSLDLEEVGDIYTHEIKSLTQGRTHFIDKTPMNFFYAGLIQKALPNARIIGLRRGAMDSCLSNYRQLFALEDRRFDYTFDLESTAAYYREFDALMTHWRSALPAHGFMEVGYEDIIAEQEPQTRKLLEFCGLGWDEACLDFHENTAPVDTASSVQVRQPLYAGSIGRWKKYGDKLDGLKAALGDLADI